MFEFFDLTLGTNLLKVSQWIVNGFVKEKYVFWCRWAGFEKGMERGHEKATKME